MLGKKNEKKKKKKQNIQTKSETVLSFPEPSIHRYDTCKHLAGLVPRLHPPRFGQEMGKFKSSMFLVTAGTDVFQ